jgi:hypothetical protein
VDEGEAAAADLAKDLVGGLRLGESYWVNSDMAALAVGAAEDLPHVRSTEQKPPAPHGLVVFDGGVAPPASPVGRARRQRSRSALSAPVGGTRATAGPGVRSPAFVAPPDLDTQLHQEPERR